MTIRCIIVDRSPQTTLTRFRDVRPFFFLLFALVSFFLRLEVAKSKIAHGANF